MKTGMTKAKILLVADATMSLPPYGMASIPFPVKISEHLLELLLPLRVPQEAWH